MLEPKHLTPTYITTGRLSIMVERQIMKFFSSPLVRQVSEAVRIERTGAHKLLNTKGVYNRSSLPKLVAVDSKEEETIGDTGKTIVETRGGGQEEYILTGRALEKSQRRQRRKDKGRDTLNWGRIQEWVAPPTESGEEEDERSEELEEKEGR